MKVQSKIILNEKKIKELTIEVQKALIQTTEELKTDIVNEQVVPFETGILQDSMNTNTEKIKEGKTSISMNTPYARRLYYHPEYKYNKAKNKNARGEWFEPWISGSKKNFIERTFATIYSKIFKGGKK